MSTQAYTTYLRSLIPDEVPPDSAYQTAEAILALRTTRVNILNSNKESDKLTLAREQAMHALSEKPRLEKAYSELSHVIELLGEPLMPPAYWILGRGQFSISKEDLSRDRESMKIARAIVTDAVLGFLCGDLVTKETRKTLQLRFYSYYLG